MSDQAFLSTLRDRLRTQDNLATAHPLFCVREEERIYGMDPQWDDNTPYIWQDHDETECTYESKAELLAAAGGDLGTPQYVIGRGEQEIEIDGRRYQRIYYVIRWSFVCAHFTEAAAERYIEENRHNLANPRIYATSQHRCWEWIAAVESLRENETSS